MIRSLEEIRGAWGLRHTPLLCNRLTLVPWRPSLAAHTVLRRESSLRPHSCDWRFPRPNKKKRDLEMVTVMDFIKCLDATLEFIDTNKTATSLTFTPEGVHVKYSEVARCDSSSPSVFRGP